MERFLSFASFVLQAFLDRFDRGGGGGREWRGGRGVKAFGWRWIEDALGNEGFDDRDRLGASVRIDLLNELIDGGFDGFLTAIVTGLFLL